MKLETLKESRIYCFASELTKKAKKHELAVLSGHIAYKMIVSAVPFAVVATVLLSSIPAAEDVILDSLEPVLASQVWTFIKYILQLAHINSTMPLLSVGTLVMIITVSSAVYSLMNGISELSDGKDVFGKRGMIKNRIFAIGITLTVFAIIIVIAFLTMTIDDKIVLDDNKQALRYILIIAMLVLVLCIVYKISPIKKIEWLIAIKRSLISSALILLLTLGMNIYYSFFAAPENLYGTFAGVAITMAWIYSIAYCILISGEIN